MEVAMPTRLRPLAFLLAMTLPSLSRGQSTDLQSYVVFGGSKVTLGSDVTTQVGDVGSNGTVRLGRGANLGEDVAGGVIKAAARSVVYGEGFFVSFLPGGIPPGAILGPHHSPITTPILTLPAPPSVAVGALTFKGTPSVITLLTPGTYRAFRASAGSTIRLAGGQYDVGEVVITGTGSVFECDVAPATCLVRVRDRLNAPASRLGGGGGGPTQGGPLTIEYAGTKPVRLGRAGGLVEANVTAPLAKLTLSSTRRSPATFKGHFVGAEVTVGPGAILTTVTIAASCGDGILSPPGEECDPPADSACPGQCLPNCQCSPPPAVPVLYSVGPSVLNNATSFGVQVFGENFLPGAQLEISDKATTAVIETLPTSWVSLNEITALVPAGMSVPSGIQRELSVHVINPGNLRSGTPTIGHCMTDTPTSPIACTSNAGCPSGAGTCVTGDQRLTMFNDVVFLNPNSAATVPGPHGLCDDGSRCDAAGDCVGIGTGTCSPKLYVTPQQHDELWVYNTGTHLFVDQNPVQSGIQGIPVGDNPFHVEILDLGGGLSRAWVVNRFDDSFSIIDTASDTELARITGTSLGRPGRLRMETEIEFNRAGTRAYLSNENLDEVQVLDISGANRDAPVWLTTIDVGVNPRGMATNAADTRLYVANIQSADISVVDIAPGSPTENQVVKTIVTRATDDIVGGRADGWEAFVIGGRAPRGITFSDAQNSLFITSIGPQTGPRAGVSQIGGIVLNPTITVISGSTENIVAHVALNGLVADRFGCTDPELMALDDARSRLYVTCQGSGTVDVLDTAALAAGTPAELATVALPLPTDATVPTLTIGTTNGPFGAKVCAAFTGNPGVSCTSNSDCTSCPSIRDGVPVVCCAVNNPIGLHNGPRGIAISADRDDLYVVNQFTTSLADLDVSPVSPASIAVTNTTSYPGAFGSDTPQRDRRLGQIDFFTDVKKTNISCASCHIDDHQDGVFFEADVAGPRLRRVLSVRSTREFLPMLQDQLLPDLTAFTDVVVHVERGGAVCTPCTELNGNFTCFPSPEGTCLLTSNSENQQNTTYAKAITFFPNPNLNADGSFATSVPLPGGRTGDAVRGEQVFDQLACARCHPEPLFTLDQFRIFNLNGFSSVQSVRMREVQTPVNMPLRNRCQDANRPTGADGSLGFNVPTLRGTWDTFPLLMSGSAGLQVVGPEPTFTGSCTNGSNGCCTQLKSPLNPGGTIVPEQHLAVGTKDAMRAVLTSPLAVPGTGHGAALSLTSPDLDALIAYIRSL
jgi:DNA-binding beta-propeller fold protein YncE